jgi:glycosyltransferase involved in cell wall biosynthesis
MKGLRPFLIFQNNMIPNKYFTIIIPCKNEERYIYRTLKSIQDQIGLKNVKVIIADANSTDATLTEIELAKNWFNKLDIEVIQGGQVSYGRNKGAELAKTPFLIFMDADAVLMDRDILLETYHKLNEYELIASKQKSTTNKLLDKLIWFMFNHIRNMMSESFSTGCYFVISKNKFNELGGFDESVTQSEDFLLSRKIPKNKFIVLNRYVGQDNRRFKKMGYITFINLVILNYLNRNNLNWFKKDVGYWK